MEVGVCTEQRDCVGAPFRGKSFDPYWSLENPSMEESFEMPLAWEQMELEPVPV